MSTRVQLSVVLAIGALIGGSLVPAPAAAAPTPGVLSARLKILTAPRLATASGAEQARAVSLPARGAGSLLRHGSTTMLAYVHVASTSSTTLARLRSSGAQLVDVSPDYGVVTVSASVPALARVAHVAGVRFVQEALTPAVIPPSGPRVGSRARPNATPPVTTCGSVTSEGDAVLGAAITRSVYKVDGTGVTVGALSDSYDTTADAPTHAEQDILSGDLPGKGNPCGRTTPVSVLEDYSGGGQTDEGRAMLQIVHDLAPGAHLAFATAFDGLYAFAANIKKLYTVDHAGVIVDDITYSEEPFWQAGPIDNAVAWVTARGVSYSSSAGNNNVVIKGHDVGSYEADAFRPVACPGALAAVYRQCHDFDGGSGVDATDGYVVPSGGFVDPDLQWAQPWGGVSDNFGLFILDHATGKVLAESTDDTLKLQMPTQLAYWANTGKTDVAVDVVIARLAGTGRPRLRDVIINAYYTGAEHLVAHGSDLIGLGETFGHNADPKAISTAATDWQSDSVPESFSSRGPLTYRFGPVTGTTSPSKPLPVPEVYAKPDLTATDGVHTTFFFGSAPGRFYGTSAAAPHVAGVVALMRQLKPSLTPAQVKSLLRSSTAPMSGGTPNSTGKGLLYAYSAANLLTHPALASGGPASPVGHPPSGG